MMCTWDCDHRETEPVCKHSARGGRKYRYVCTSCGRYVGEWLNEGELSAKERRAATTYDGAKERRQASVERELQRKNKLDADAAWWKRYEEYINNDPGWKMRRGMVLGRACGRCEGCSIAPAVHVHHLTYEHLGNEFLWELKAVCIKCHERLHPHRKGALRSKKLED